MLILYLLLGVKIVIRQVGPGMIQQMQSACNECSGTGTVIPDKDRCKKCHGDKVSKEKKTLEVHVAKGSTHSQKITFSGEADESPNTIAGDVVVVLQQQEHAIYKREGPNLHVKRKILLAEALCGFSFTIKHLDDRVLLVRSEPGEIITPGEHKVIRGQGMPSLKNPFIKGDLFIEFDIEFPAPNTLTANQIQALSAALPQPAVDMDIAEAEEALKANSETHEEVSMEGNVDIRQERVRAAHAQRSEFADGEEDDEDPRGGQQAQCRQA